MSLDNYGSGQSGVVLLEQTGPFPPPEDAFAEARLMLTGKHPTRGPVCMDCCPNLILMDYKCQNNHWHWGYGVAHDDTCPTLKVLESGVEE